jgi:hypothetical protein
MTFLRSSPSGSAPNASKAALVGANTVKDAAGSFRAVHTGEEKTASERQNAIE